MKKMLSIPVLFSIALSGCTITIEDLENTGIRKAWTLEEEYQTVGHCLVRWLEREDPGHTIIHAGVGFGVQYRPFPSAQKIEILQKPNNSVIFWVLTLTPDQGGTLASLLMEPMSPGWKIDALEPGILRCGQKVAAG